MPTPSPQGLIAYLPLFQSFVGALGAFGVAAFTVWVTSRQARDRATEQRNHDTQQKDLDRKAALRRDVYLAGAEQIVRTSAVIGGLAGSETPLEALTDAMRELGGAGAKLALISEPETSLETNELVATYSRIALRLMAKILPIMNIRGRMKVQVQQYADTQTEINRILAAMRLTNEVGHSESEKFRAFNHNLQFAQGQAAKFEAARRDLNEQLVDLQIDFARSTQAFIAEVSEQQLKLMGHIRRDIGLGGEVDAYLAQLRRNRDLIAQETDILNASIQEIRKATLQRQASPGTAG